MGKISFINDGMNWVGGLLSMGGRDLSKYAFYATFGSGKDKISKNALTVQNLAAGRPIDMDSGELAGANEPTIGADGLLTYGAYTQLVQYSEDTDNWSGSGPWTQTITLTTGTFTLSTSLDGASLTGTSGTAVVSGTMNATFGNAATFEITTAGTIIISTDTANPKAQVTESPYRMPYVKSEGSTVPVPDNYTIDTTHGYQWTIGTLLNTALTAGEGALEVKWVPQYDWFNSPGVNRGIVSSNNIASTELYLHTSNNEISMYDNINYVDLQYTNFTWEAGKQYSIKLSWGVHPVLGTSKMQVTVIDEDGTEYQSAIVDFDGDFSTGSYLYAAFVNNQLQGIRSVKYYKEAQWSKTLNIYIDSAASAGGDGSKSSPYNLLSDINWTTGGDKSVTDWIAADCDVNINLTGTFTSTLTIGASGSSSANITVKGYNSGVLFDSITGNGITAVLKNYITLKDLTITSPTNDCINITGNNYNLSSIQMNTPGNNGMFWADGSNLLVTDCVVNTPNNAGFVVYGAPTTQANNTIFTNCTAYGAVGNDGFTFHRDALANDIGANHTLINCTGYNNNENSFDLTSGSNFTLSGCTCYGDGDASIYVGGNSFGDVEISNCSISDTSYGVYITSANVTVKFCVFTGSFADTCILCSAGDCLIINNTIFIDHYVLEINDPDSLTFKNNVWDIGTYSRAVRNLGTVSLDNFILDNNIGYSSSTDQRFWYDQPTTELVTLINVQTLFNIELNSSISDPLLLSDGKLEAGSPALNAGVVISGVNDNNQEDIWGNETDSTPNIGAYQGSGE